MSSQFRESSVREGGDGESRRTSAVLAELDGDDDAGELAASLEAASEPLAERVRLRRVHEKVDLARSQFVGGWAGRTLAVGDEIRLLKAVVVLDGQRAK